MAERRSMQEVIALLEMQDAVDARIGVYTIATLSLAAAIRRVRPFTRFTKPSDVPKRFLRSRTKLNGTVKRIEPSGGLLMVQHKPLFHILRTKVDCLPVKISGVSVNSNGLSWLQTIVAGNKISFIPVFKDKTYLECEVMMNQKTQDNKEKTLYLGPTLVSIGFGNINPIEKSLSKNGFHLAYYKTLKNAEIIAEKKKLGKWYYVKITNDFSTKILKYILSKSLAFFASKTKPKIVKSTEYISDDKIARLTEKIEKLEKLDKAEKVATA